MLRNILIGCAFLLALFLLYASTRPDTFTVARSTTIDATAAEVFVHVNDFRHWAQWSPWDQRDPAMAREFSGNDSGIGAVYAWKGNRDVGRGRMEITGVVIPYSVRIQLDIYEPMVAHNTSEFLLEPDGNGTKVTWQMTGKHNKLAKLLSVFVSMDSMVGPDFEQGLANLKALSEKKP
jgi:hypothetical protein